MRITPVFSFIAGLFAPLLFAQGYDSLVRHDLGAVADLSPQVVAATSNGGLWVSAQDPIDENSYQLVHFDANGNRVAGLHFPQLSTSRYIHQSLYALADQGVLEVRAEEYRCTLRRIESDGKIKFERTFFRKFFGDECSVKISEPESNYLIGATLLAQDGSQVIAFSPVGQYATFIDVELTDAGRGLLFLQTNSARTGFDLRRVDASGQQMWLTPVQNAQTDPNNGNYDISMRALRNGGAIVAFANGANLKLALYDPFGQLLSTQSLALSEGSRVHYINSWVSDDLGNIALALTMLRPANQGTDDEFVVLSPDGNILKRVRVTPQDACRDSCQILGLASGFAHLKTENVFTEQSQQQLVVISPDPKVESIVRNIDFADAPILSRGKNGSILALDSNDNDVKTLKAYDAQGLEIEAPSLLARGRTQPEVFESLIADDGKSFVQQYTPELRQGVQRLVVYAPSGVELWRKNVLYGNRMVVDSERVCLTKLENAHIALICYRSDNGLEIVNTSIAVVPEYARYRVRFLADGRLRMVIAEPNLKVLDVSNDNQMTQFSVPISTFNIVDLSATGSVLFTNGAGISPVKDWVVMLPSGEIAFRHPLPPDTYSADGKLLPNNSTLLFTKKLEYDPYTVTLLSPGGLPIWTIVPTQPFFTPGSGEAFSDASTVYLGYRSFSESFGPPFMNMPFAVRAFSLIDGHLLWTKDFKQNRVSQLGFFAGANSSEILVAVNHELGTELSRLASTSGTLLEQRMLPCESAKCSAEATAVDRNGDFRSITIAADPGHESLVLARTATGSMPPTIALDQPGLSGAWYTPQLSGQGFFFEYFPQNRLLFAPWFTFTSENSPTSGEELNSNSVSNLRWHTLSGIIESNAKVAKLEIRSSYAGVFDSVPTTTSKVVGTATLRAHDCNHATLEFEFINSELYDGFPGKHGVLPLTRLTGGSAPCQLSSGQTLPGRDARPAFGGFDSRQSGSWYQPMTAGQGLMMTVQPATPSAPGFFFGGWFTYDAGVPNDPTTQHWLTLSGEIPVNAQPGVVEVAIYRTLGGQLAGTPTQNNTIVGHGTVTFSGCDVAVLRYQFDDAPIVGAFKARSGQINLSRLGACPAQ